MKKLWLLLAVLLVACAPLHASGPAPDQHHVTPWISESPGGVSVQSDDLHWRTEIAFDYEDDLDGFIGWSQISPGATESGYDEFEVKFTEPEFPWPNDGPEFEIIWVVRNSEVFLWVVCYEPDLYYWDWDLNGWYSWDPNADPPTHYGPGIWGQKYTGGKRWDRYLNKIVTVDDQGKWRITVTNTRTRESVSVNYTSRHYPRDCRLKHVIHAHEWDAPQFDTEIQRWTLAVLKDGEQYSPIAATDPRWPPINTDPAFPESRVEAAEVWFSGWPCGGFEHVWHPDPPPVLTPDPTLTEKRFLPFIGKGEYRGQHYSKTRWLQ